MKIHSFNRSNISLYYFSPYTEFRIEEGKAFFYHSLFDKTLAFYLKDNGLINYFFETMGDGNDEQTCLDLIAKSIKTENPADVLTTLMQSGIIE
jgi:hypothetical protein